MRKTTVVIIGLVVASFLFVHKDALAEDPILPKIQQAIKEKGLSWTAAETGISRLSPEKRRLRLGVMPEEKDSLESKKPNPVTLAYPPPGIDWRDVGGQDWTTSIKDQSSCGSCVAFGTNAALESRLEIYNNNSSLSPDLSEAHLFFCGGGTCDTGWYPSAAMHFAQYTGVVDEACFPYQPVDLPCDPCTGWEGRVTKIGSWWGTSDVAVAKQAIADNGPVEVTMDVYTDFYYYTSGVYSNVWGDYEGGHAITVVGYDDVGDYWIVKNSWGTDWGESGWFRIAYGECEIDDYFYVPEMAPGGGLDCDNAFPASCGGSYSDDTTGAPSNVSSYSCSSWDESGPEHVYELTTSESTTIVATLSNLSADLDVFILSACDPDSCEAYGNTTATYNNAPAGTYYIVVDGYMGAAGSYSLDVSCGGGGLDCDNAFLASCGGSYSDDTTGAPSNVSGYGCVGWNESGPEHVYELTTSESTTIVATLSDLSADLDVFILSACDPSSCEAYGNTSATYNNAPPGTYYIVVDGYMGAAGSYSLDISCQGPSAWQIKSSLSVARSRLAVAAVNGKVYAIGGEDATSASPASKESKAAGRQADTVNLLGWNGVVEEYNPSTDTWTTKAPMPTGASNISAGVINDKIYVAGGYAGGSYLSSLQIYDPATNNWSSGASLPQPRAGAASAVVNDRLYVIGGRDASGDYMATCYEYNPSTNSWVTKASMNHARSWAAAGVVNGKIYVVGGCASSSTNLNYVEEYNPGTNTWSTKAPMLSARGGPGAVGVGNYLYVVGGGWDSYLTSAERYNPSSNSWVAFDPLNIGRRTLGLTEVNNKLYAVGGWDGDYSADTEEYNLGGGEEPDIEVIPPSFDVTLLPDQSTQRTMTIRNVGQGTLSFNISDVETSGGSLPGPTIIPGGGGPDAFGYIYRDSTEVDGPAYQWIEINATGTDMGLSDDTYFWSISLPWDLDFYGTLYNQVAVGSNGTVYFMDDYLGLSNECLPGDGGYDVPTFIAGYWDDLNPSADGAVYYEIRGSPGSRVLIVEWDNVPHYGTSDPLTYEVILFEDSNSILIQYLDASSEAGSGGTVGIQGDLTTNYLEYSCNAPVLQDSLAICFAYPGQPLDCSTVSDAPWLSEYPASGTVLADDSQNVAVTIDATGLAVGTYTADIIIANNDPDENPVTVPVTLHVEGGTTYCISGYVRDGGGGGIGGVTVSFSGDGSTTTDGNGYYSKCGFSDGTYTVTPSKTGCTFDPSSTQVTVSGADVTNVNFTGDCPEGTVDLSIVPSPKTVAVNAIFTVDIQVDAGSQLVDAVDAFLSFDRNYLRVVDASGNETNSIIPGSTLPLVLQNSADNSTGRITYSAGKQLGSPSPSGTFTLASIRFKAMALTTGTTVAFLAGTDVFYQGDSVLDSTYDGTVIIIETPFRGQVALQGRGSAGDPRWENFPLTVIFYPPGGSTPVETYNATTDRYGVFSVAGVSPGTYDVEVKNVHTLSTKRTNVTVPTGTEPVNFCTLLEGDANDDDLVAGADFSILATTYGLCQGEPGYDGRADFNGDDCIGGADFSLLATNYGQQGPLPCSGTSAVLSAVETAGTVDVNIQPPTKSVSVGEIFTLDIQIAAGAQGVDAVDAYLSFDRNYLRVVDAGGNETNSIIAGSTLPLVMLNSADNSTGHITYSAGKELGSPSPSGTFVLATIRLKAIAGTPPEGTPITFLGSTDVFYEGDSVLDKVSGGVVIAASAPTATPTVTPTATPTPTPTSTPLPGYKIYLPLITKVWPPIPDIPVLYSISNPDGDGNYTVSWNPAERATSYTLEEDDNSAFSSPTTQYTGSGTSWTASGKTIGTYYYRVRASNSWGDSGWSNVQSVSVQPAQWVTILSEDFEGAFPGSTWEVSDNDPDSGRYYWGKRDCRDHGGSFSAWSVGAGDTTLSCGSNYPNDVFAWMIYGPFSLTGATAAELTFDWWSDTEHEYDIFFWGASTDGEDCYGTVVTGNWSSWTAGELLDLSAVPTLGNLLGEDQVWIAFVFGSDYSVTDRGSFVDNVLLRKWTGASASRSEGPVSPQHIPQPDQTLEFTSLRLKQ